MSKRKAAKQDKMRIKIGEESWERLQLKHVK